MHKRVHKGGLDIDVVLHDFIVNEVLPETGVSAEHFWKGFEQTLETLGGKNKELLEKRDALQEKLDAWYKAHKGKELCPDTHEHFLRSIGYLVPTPSPCSISRKHQTSFCPPRCAHDTNSIRQHDKRSIIKAAPRGCPMQQGHAALRRDYPWQLPAIRYRRDRKPVRSSTARSVVYHPARRCSGACPVGYRWYRLPLR